MDDAQSAPAEANRCMSMLAVPIGRASDSDEWLNALRSTGPRRDEAIVSLHALLSEAARAVVGRHRASVACVAAGELDDLAAQAADDALVTVLDKLDEFRATSQFRIWASKFAMFEAGVRIRRQAWQHRTVVLDAIGSTQVTRSTLDPSHSAEHVELVEALAQSIDADLTAHQRCVLVALAIDGVPIDVLAGRLNTTRGALYETLHDARQILRGCARAMTPPRPPARRRGRARRHPGTP